MYDKKYDLQKQQRATYNETHEWYLFNGQLTFWMALSSWLKVLGLGARDKGNIIYVTPSLRHRYVLEPSW